MCEELISIVFKLIIISSLLLLSLLSDLKTYKIKNSITFSFMLAGLAVNLAFEGYKGLVFSLQGILLPAVCLIILYAVRVVGAGDIKLLSAVGAVMGSGFALYAAVYSFICGGLIASCIILLRNNWKERFSYLFAYIKSCFLSMELLQYSDFHDIKETGRFHFSVAVASGTVLAIIINGMGLTL
ncbi:MAG TPA: prepilin peptidase [Clostridia bacterium]|nr:prepilin peptidase [Clostridia bacterium]